MAISTQYKPIGLTPASKSSPLTLRHKPRFPMKELIVLLGALFVIVVISWQATPSLTRSQLAPAPTHLQQQPPAAVQAPTHVQVQAPAAGMAHSPQLAADHAPAPAAAAVHVAPAHPLAADDTNRLLGRLLIDDACLVGAKACTGNVETPAGSHHTVVRACSVGYRATACNCFGLTGPHSFKSATVSRSFVANQCACTFVSDAPQGLARWAMDIACRPL